MSNKCFCDKCGAEFVITPHHRTNGDLDIMYIKCTTCGEEYLVSVTDSVLRDAIEKYKTKMNDARIAADPDTSVALAIEASKIDDENTVRFDELRRQYLETNKTPDT